MLRGENMKILKYDNAFRNKPIAEIQRLVTQGYLEACLELIYRSPLNDDGTGKNFEVTANDAWATIEVLTRQKSSLLYITAIKAFQYYKEGDINAAYNEFRSLEDCKEKVIADFVTTYEKIFYEKMIDHLLKKYSTHKAEATHYKKDNMKHALYIKAYVALLEALQIALKLGNKTKNSDKIKYIHKNYILKILSKYIYKEDIYKINQNAIEYFYACLVSFLFSLQKSDIQKKESATIADQKFIYQFDTFKTDDKCFQLQGETKSYLAYHIKYPSNLYSRYEPWRPNEKTLISYNEDNLVMPHFFEKYFF